MDARCLCRAHTPESRRIAPARAIATQAFFCRTRFLGSGRSCLDNASPGGGPTTTPTRRCRWRSFRNRQERGTALSPNPFSLSHLAPPSSVPSPLPAKIGAPAGCCRRRREAGWWSWLSARARRRRERPRWCAWGQQKKGERVKVAAALCVQAKGAGVKVAGDAVFTARGFAAGNP